MNRPVDQSARFEAALEQADTQAVSLQLFIAGMGPRSTQAVADLKNLCKEYGERCNVEIVDIYEHPGAAAAAQIVAVPALVKNWPLPRRKLIGTIGSAVDAACTLGLRRREPEGAI